MAKGNPTELPKTLLDRRGPLVYRCAQPVLFVKRSEQPESTKIVKVKQPVGARINSTGVVWTGPNGGKWAQLDTNRGEIGWALVHGPGFGLSGPALVDFDRSLNLQVFLLGGMEKEQQGLLWEAVMPKTATVKEVTHAMCRVLDLRPESCILAKDRPCCKPDGGELTQERLPVDFMPELRGNQVLGECGFEQGQAILMLVYVGDMPEHLTVERRPIPRVPDARESREKLRHRALKEESQRQAAPQLQHDMKLSITH